MRRERVRGGRRRWAPRADALRAARRRGISPGASYRRCADPLTPTGAGSVSGLPGAQWFTTWDGIRIAYQEWGDAGSPPVVLHHGFVANADANWLLTGVVDALLAAGHRVIAPDARGHGASDKPHDPVSYGEHLMARDLVVLLEIVQAPQVDLVGYSMGAVVSLIYAAEHERLRRLIVGGSVRASSSAGESTGAW